VDPLHPAAWLVTVALWVAALAGAGGVAAGLVAARRGWRPPVKMLVVAALAATAVLAVLPPAGSTDSLDYAAYGRMVAIGHDPYVMTPEQLRLSGDPVGVAAPIPWETKHSLYGPLATIEQGTAAILGGISAARITFWLKVWNALAFTLVVLALDRLLRADPAGRVRAHMLWSLNPLLLWGWSPPGTWTRSRRPWASWPWPWSARAWWAGARRAGSPACRPAWRRVPWSGWRPT
jgi:hypothetical protein